MTSRKEIVKQVIMGTAITVGGNIVATILLSPKDFIYGTLSWSLLVKEVSLPLWKILLDVTIALILIQWVTRKILSKKYTNPNIQKSLEKNPASSAFGAHADQTIRPRTLSPALHALSVRKITESEVRNAARQALGMGVSKTENMAPYTDHNDVVTLLESWLGGKESLSTSVIDFSETDKELGLLPGSTEKCIEEAAKQWNLVVKRKGSRTIQFSSWEQDRDRR